MTDPCQVLIVEDEFLTQVYLQDLVEEFGYEVCGATDTADRAVEMASGSRPQVVLMDMRLRGVKVGVDAALEIYERHRIPVIFITASNDPQTIERIQQDHPSATLIKPVVPERLKRVLKEVLQV